jgi:hypothetical protein
LVDHPLSLPTPQKVKLMETLHRNLLLITQAVSFRSDKPHTLEVAHGRAWVTLVGQLDKANPDIFLTDGQTLQVDFSQHVVLEPWPRFPGDELSVQWVEL